MLHFILAVLFTVSLYLLMRSFPKFNINPLHAVVFNYYTCVATGLFFMPNRQAFFDTDWTSSTTLLTLALGIVFVVVFVLIGLTATKVGVTAASLASNMSLVIPVLFGLFIFKNNNKDFTFLNYLGLLLALVALYLSTLKKEESTAPKAGWLLFLPALLFLGSGSNNTLINYISATFYKPDQSALFTAIACVGAVVSGTSFLLFRIFFQGEKVAWVSVLGGFVLGIPNFFSFYFLLAALSDFGNSAAFVFPIYNILSMLTSALMAYILFKEKLQPLNKLGLALAVLAICLISYQEILAALQS